MWSSATTRRPTCNGWHEHSHRQSHLTASYGLTSLFGRMATSCAATPSSTRCWCALNKLHEKSRKKPKKMKKWRCVFLCLIFLSAVWIKFSHIYGQQKIKRNECYSFTLTFLSVFIFWWCVGFFVESGSANRSGLRRLPVFFPRNFSVGKKVFRICLLEKFGFQAERRKRPLPSPFALWR